MRKVKIITDSCSDLNKKLLEQYDIDYVKMFTVYEGKQTAADLTWTAEEAHALYEIMRAGNRVTTTQVPVEEFMRVFRFYLDKEMDIVYIGCSSKQSGSVNTGAMVAGKLNSEYPDAKIFCIDSLNASLGIGVLAIEAAKLAASGRNAEEIAEKITSIRKNINEFVTVHSLDSLKKAGRVTGSAAFFGNLMGVKPIIISDADGVQTPVKKVKGRKNSFKEIVAMLKDVSTDTITQTIYFAHADCSREEVDELVELIKAEIPCAGVECTLMGPIIGASVGPDAVGIWAFGKEVTWRASEAK